MYQVLMVKKQLFPYSICPTLLFVLQLLTFTLCTITLLRCRIYGCTTHCLAKLTMSVSTVLSVASVALCTLPTLWKSVQTEEKLGTSMTQHGGMHQRMWPAPSLSASQSVPVCCCSSSPSCCG